MLKIVLKKLYFFNSDRKKNCFTVKRRMHLYFMSLRSGTLYTEVRINDCYTPVMISNSRIKIRSVHVQCTQAYLNMLIFKLLVKHRIQIIFLKCRLPKPHYYGSYNFWNG